MTDLIGQTIENFRIERQIGQGGMGVVYEATDTSLNRKVALKIMHKHLAARESFQQRFVREAQNAARLKHPNIVQIHHFFSKNGQLYLIMELLEDGSLQDYMRRLREQGRRMEQAEAIELVRQIAGGLHYAHQQGMVHRDMKPGNILLTRSTDDASPATIYRAMIADFGLAKLLQDMQTSQTGPVGTLAYMSPEQILGGKVDHRSDIYALGVMLFELLVGYRPFNPQSLRDAVRAHRSGPVLTAANRPAGLDVQLEEILNRCLAPDPQDRYQSAHEIVQALRQLQGSSNQVMQKTEPEQPPPTPVAAPVPPPPPPPENKGGTHVTNMTWPNAAPSMYPPADRSDLFGFDLLMIRYKNQQLDPLPIRQDIITIGRDASNHVALQGTKGEVSRVHARIERNPEGGYYIVDLGSTNGTYLGRDRLPPKQPRYWDPDKSVRIGDYWLKLDLMRNRNRSGALRQQPGQTQQHVISQPPADSMVAAESEHIQVTANQTNIIVEAGSFSDIMLTVLNRSKFVDHYAVSVEGLPSDWVVLPDKQLKLLPEKQDMFSVRLHPPRLSTSRAGQHRFVLRIASVKYNNVFTTIPGILEINPFYQFKASIQPRLVNTYEQPVVTISNEGNATDYFTLNATDNQYALTYELPDDPIPVEAGQTVDVSIGVAPRKPILVGSARVQPFDVTVTGKGQLAGMKQLSAALQVQPPIPRIAIGLAGALGLLSCIGLTLGAIALLSASGNAQQANATATAQVVLTQALDQDTDGDGLSDNVEREMLLDINNSDTDGDGLSDGDEVRVYGTDPKKRDTDGDGIPDGDEVAGCTNPLEKDSDGDGLADNVDPAPCELPSPTPTGTPTNIPTAEPPPTGTPTNTPPPTAVPPTVPPPPTVISATATFLPLPSSTVLPIPTDTETPTPTP